MKKKSVKMILSLILVFVLVLSNIISAYAYNIETASITSSGISGKIYFDEISPVDISEVKLDIYRMELLKDDEVSSQYVHIYETTVSPDKEGNITINRPSSYCYIEIDEESIPIGFGVDKNSLLIGLGENEFSLTLSSVSDFKIDFSNDDVKFYANDKTPLFVNSKYEVKYDSIKKAFLDEVKYSNENIRKSFLNNEDVSAKCVFDDFSIKSRQQTDALSTTEKIDYLCRNNLITEEEKVSLYISNLKSGQISEEIEIEKAFAAISAFSSNDLSRELNEEITNLVSSYIPTYENEAIYTDDYFSVHYEEDAVSFRNVQLVVFYLNYVKTSMCSTFIFETPELAPGESTYQVYLTSGQSYSGLTVPVTVSGETYSFININIDNGTGTLSNYTLGTACHEFMHAIQFQYDSYQVNQHYDEMIHFNEAVANAVKVRLVENSGIGYFVNKFQNSPELSLLSSPNSGDYLYRCYGAVLFPLTLIKSYSNFNTIRKIYEEIQDTPRINRDIYTAIDSVLQENNSSSIQDAYAKCALHNYNIQHYYNYCETSWQTTPKLTAVSTTSVGYSALPLSSRYFEISDTSYSIFAISFSNADHINSAELQRVDTIDGELSNLKYSIFTPNSTMFFNVAPGDKTCMILSNISVSSSIDYSVRVF